MEKAKLRKENIALQVISGKRRALILVACALCADGLNVDKVIEKLQMNTSEELFNFEQLKLLHEKYLYKKTGTKKTQS